MDRFTNVVTSSKNFVVRHKMAFAITGTAAVLVTLNRMALADYNAFIEEKDLTEEFVTYLTRSA